MPAPKATDSLRDGEKSFDDESDTGEIATVGRKVSIQTAAGGTLLADSSELKQLSFSDYQAMFEGQLVSVSDEELSDQFGPILNDRAKDRLVGVPFIVVSWTFNHSEKFGADFVSMLVVTQSSEKFIVNDGSTGICAQLQVASAKKGITGGLACPKGLRASDYDLPEPLPVGNKAGRTYYLDTSL